MDRKVAVQVGHHLLVAHGMATRAIRSINSDANVGIALNLAPCEPDTDSEKSRTAAAFNWQRDCAWFLDPLFKACYPPNILRHLGGDAPTTLPNDFALISQNIDFPA